MHNLMVFEMVYPIGASNHSIESDSDVISSILLVIKGPRPTFKAQVMQITEGQSLSKLSHLPFISFPSRPVFTLCQALVKVTHHRPRARQEWFDPAKEAPHVMPFMRAGFSIHKGTSPFHIIGLITNGYINVIGTQLKQMHLNTLIPKQS
jgi:hypothetical protein